MSASLCETVIMCCVNVKKCLDPVFLKMLCYKHAIKRTIITGTVGSKYIARHYCQVAL